MWTVVSENIEIQYILVVSMYIHMHMYIHYIYIQVGLSQSMWNKVVLASSQIPHAYTPVGDIMHMYTVLVM